MTDKLSFNISNEADCYIASIEKLDLFIKTIVDKLEEKKLDYEILYFSDHGLSVSEERVYHATDLYEEFTIPLFLLGNNIQNKEIVQKQVSAIHFLDFYAQFLNIEHSELNPNYNLYNLSNITSDYDPIYFWKSYIPITSLTKHQSVILPSIDKNIDSFKELDDFEYSTNCQAYLGDPILIKNNIVINGWIAQEKNKLPIKEDVGIAYKVEDKIHFYKALKHQLINVAIHLGIKDPEDYTYGFWVKSIVPINNSNLYLSYMNKKNELVMCLNQPVIVKTIKIAKEVNNIEYTDECKGYIDHVEREDNNLTIYGWMAQENKLPFHQKIGVFYDINNQYYFHELDKNARSNVAEYFEFKHPENILYGFNGILNMPEKSKNHHLSYMKNEDELVVCRNKPVKFN